LNPLTGERKQIIVADFDITDTGSHITKHVSCDNIIYIRKHIKDLVLRSSYAVQPQIHVNIYLNRNVACKCLT